MNNNNYVEPHRGTGYYLQAWAHDYACIVCGFNPRDNEYAHASCWSTLHPNERCVIEDLCMDHTDTQQRMNWGVTKMPRSYAKPWHEVVEQSYDTQLHLEYERLLQKNTAQQRCIEDLHNHIDRVMLDVYRLRENTTPTAIYTVAVALGHMFADICEPSRFRLIEIDDD